MTGSFQFGHRPAITGAGAGGGGNGGGAGGGNGVTDNLFNTNVLLIHANGTNGASNNTFLDGSANAIAITRNGTPTQGTFSPFSQTGWSAYFNGTTDYLYYGTTALNFLATGGTAGIALTIEAWVYTTAYNAGGSPWMYNPIIALGGTYMNFGVLNGKVRFYWYDGGYQTVTSANTTDVPLNTWVHICVTVSTTTVKLFVNGTLNTTSATYTGIASAGANNAVYVSVEGNAAYKHSGYISNLRVVNDVLYTATFTPSTTPLTAVTNTKLLVFQDNRFVDRSSSGFTPTITGTPSIQAFSPFAPVAGYSTSTVGGSMYFSGTNDYLSTTVSSSAFTFGTADWTVEFWTYPLIFGNMGLFQSSTVSGGMVANSGSGGIQIYFTGSATIGIEINGGWLNTATTVLNRYAWHHIALVKSSNNVKLYINGKVDSGFGTVSDTTNYTATYACVGGYYSTSYLCNAYISNLRVVNGTAGYTGNFTLPTAPLTTTQSSGTNIAAISSGTSLLLDGANGAILDQTSKHDLIASGSVQISTAQQKFGTGSLYFNGTTDYITTAGINPILMFGTGAFTIEHWIKYTATTAYINTIGDNSSFTTTNNFLLMWNYAGAGRLTFWINNAGVCSTANAYNDNAWHHVAVTRTTAGVITIWVDGIADGTASGYSATNVGTGSIIIGNQTGLSRYWSGYIDEVRISRTARYTSAFTPTTVEFGDSGGGVAGGTITTNGAYTIHTFTASGSIIFPTSKSVDYLVVAGGGGGGSFGGGGAGGLLTSTMTMAAGTYTVTIGGGGPGATSGSVRGTNGQDSVFGSVTATGGGGGGAFSNTLQNGLAGGSGGAGGAAASSPYTAGAVGTGTVGQGNNGGASFTGANASGGGGGAGAVGGTATSGVGGNGGVGLASSFSGSSVYYAGGGGGAAFITNGTGGNGGGGNATGSPFTGIDNKGGGGAGGYATAGYSGGSGVVIIRYLT
jgi:hypothetical protein